jgi:YVTN family beta-propeller protein
MPTLGTPAPIDFKQTPPPFVYIADTYNNALKIFDTTTNTVTTAVSSGLYYPGGVAVSPAMARQQTPAPYDGFLYINFMVTSGLPIGKLYISTDSTNPISPGYVELDFIGKNGPPLVVPVKKGSYCFMIGTALPTSYVLYYQPLVPQSTGG